MELTNNNNNSEKEFNDIEIIKSIWLEPRKTFKFLLETNYQKWVLLLMILGGIAGTIENTSSEGYGDKLPIGGVILIAIIGGVFFGWFGYYIFSLLLAWTGKWLDGTADSDKLLLVIAYAQIPIIITIILYILELLLFKTSEFTFDQFMGLDIGKKLILVPLIALELILSIWSMALAVIGVSEVQNFSILKSIINLILPTIVLAIPIIIFVLIFKVF